MKASDCILFSGGAPGAEAEFGACAERHGVEEVNFTFEGHKIIRHRGVRVLNHEELQNGDVSLEYVSRLMQRRYTDAPTIRRVLQTMWYQVNSGQEIWVIGTILADKTIPFSVLKNFLGSLSCFRSKPSRALNMHIRLSRLAPTCISSSMVTSHPVIALTMSAVSCGP